MPPIFSPPSKQRLHHGFFLGALIGLTVFQPVLEAASNLPTARTFVAGSGAINSSANAMVINQSTLRGIIDWGSFSIGRGGTVTFNNGNGGTLNRVTGNQMSSILGSLFASGTVYLINPEGVVVGPHGASTPAATNVNSGVTISNHGAGSLMLRADNTSSGAGTVNLNGSSMLDWSQSTGVISILYNPPDTLGGSVVPRGPSPQFLRPLTTTAQYCNPISILQDKGVIISNQLRSPVFHSASNETLSWLGNLQPLGFWDWANLSAVQPSEGGLNHISASSAGFGLRYNLRSNLPARSGYGWQLQHIPGFGNRSQLLSFSLIASY